MGIFDGLTQTGRALTATTPVGEDSLFPTRLTGVEALSRPFQFSVDLAAPFGEVTAAEMLGKPVGLTIDAPGQPRFVHGLVSRWTELGIVGVGELGIRTYRADLVPGLWLLGLSSDCRTFEGKTVQQIVEAVFSGAGYSAFRWRLTGATPTVPYVAQYQETDLAFVSRLLEEYGLWYTFEHEASAHRMVISNSVGTAVPVGVKAELEYSAYVRPLATGQPIPGLGGVPGATLPNIPGSPPGTRPGEAGGKAVGGVVGSLLGPLGTTAGAALGSLFGGWLDDKLQDWFGIGGPPGDAVIELVRERVVHTAGVAARDFHLQRAPDSASQTSSAPGATGARFTFLGDQSGTASAGVATDASKRLIELEEAGQDVFRGSSTAPHLVPGTRVKLKKGIAGTSGVDTLVSAVAHVVETGSLVGADRGRMRYFNEFGAAPAATPYLPERGTPRPSVRGTQTAKIVGVGGAGQIDVDADGGVLLEFPWDRGAGKEGASQHRVPVASYWAGAGWGAVHWPRVGQLVLVEFLEGDPDRPIVTGRVYSNNHARPYALAADKTQSGIKSRTVGGGAENFNELRFEDKQNEEHVFLQAEKDLTVNVKHDETRAVGHDRVATVQHLDHHLVPGGDGDAKGEQKLKVTKGDQFFVVGEGRQFMVNQKGDQAVHALDGRQMMRIEKGPQDFMVDDGDRTVDVPKGNNTATISGTDATSADTITLTAQTKIELKVGGNKLTITTSGIEITAGGSSIKLDPSAIKAAAAQIEHAAQGTLKNTGAMVTVQGSGMVKVAGPMVQAAGDALLKLAAGVAMHG